jgi:GNAT superfamily N-acetyltransferase
VNDAAPPGARRVVVRRATQRDVPAIRTIATDAWRDTYRDQLRDETIERFVTRAYSEERVALRVERHETWVATLDGVIGAFAETVIEPHLVTLVAIYADPARRRLGLGSALLDAIVGAHPELPIAADVLAGNRLGEAWYEARGFAPSEDIEEELAGELVRERRWWRPAGGQGRGPGTRP